MVMLSSLIVSCNYVSEMISMHIEQTSLRSCRVLPVVSCYQFVDVGNSFVREYGGQNEF